MTPPASEQAALHAFLRERLSDARCGWSAGTFGAIAEFRRDAGEPCRIEEDTRAITVSTPRGALRLALSDAMRAIAFESPAAGRSWQRTVALCLPDDAASMHGRRAVTELGADGDAVHEADRDARLFDLGFGCRSADLCVRTADPSTLAALRAHAGEAPGARDGALLARMPELSPHRVFATRLARIEVLQPIPPPHGVSPDGPHTHVLPALMREGRTHAATHPIPEGWTPCVSLHLPVDGDGDAADGFEQVLGRWGVPSLIAFSHAVRRALDDRSADGPGVTTATRHERLVARVAIRQWTARAGPDAALPEWARAFGAREASPTTRAAGDRD